LVRVAPGSQLAGKTLIESRLKEDNGLLVVGAERSIGVRSEGLAATPELTLGEEDILLIKTPEADWRGAEALGLLEIGQVPDGQRPMQNELGLVEVVVSPRSRLRGKTFRELGFRRQFGLLVLGMQRARRTAVPAAEDDGEAYLTQHKLAVGDTLLLGGPWTLIAALKHTTRDMLVLHLSSDWREAAPAYRRAPHAMVILVGLMALMIFSLVPAVTAVILASVALVLTGCLEMKHVYRCIDWQSLVLIAGMLPMGEALEKTGGINCVVDGMLSWMGSMGPFALMAALFLLTAVFSQFISNTATAVLVTPIGIGVAAQLGVAPQPMVMAIALAASAAFVTPVASPVNTLVLGPGGYRFSDFAKVGLPLLVITLALTLLTVPLLFPF
jgi:di/tricarboxylate transporter